MGSLVYQVICSSALLSLGLYHLISTTRNYLKSPHTYAAKPFHPLPNTTSHPRLLRPIQLYLIIFSLLIAIAHQLILAADSDPLVKGATPVHRLTSLQSASLLFLFLLLSLSLLLSDSTPSLLPLPHDLSFAFLSLLFLLHSSLQTSLSNLQTSALEAKCDSVSANLSALISLLCLLLACLPRLFPADAALAGSLCLRGLWALQTGLSLYADAFIPEGCHRLLDVVNGVQGSTQCDLDESKFRALAILDLALVVHAMFVMLIVLITYAVVAKTVGGGVRRLGSYEALPTASSPTDSNHIQMKALAGTQAVAAGIFQINTAVATFRRLVDSVGTVKDTREHRQKLHNTRQRILQLVKDTSAKLKSLSESDRDANANANKKIEDAKLARDFQTTLQEFQKVQQLASERESTYTPAAPASSLPTSSGGSGEESVEIDSESQPFIREQKRQGILLLDNEISFNEAMIDEREQGIREVEEQIGQANEIFKDLAVLVHDQGIVIDDIQSNIDASAGATSQAKVQLVKASKGVKSRTSWCWWVLVIVVAVLVILLIVLIL